MGQSEVGLLLLEEEPNVLPHLPSPLADFKNHILRELFNLKLGCPLAALGGWLLRAFSSLVYLEVHCMSAQEAWVLVLTQPQFSLGPWANYSSLGQFFLTVSLFIVTIASI